MASLYINAIKGKEAKVKLHLSPRRQAMKDQEGVCAKCKKQLNPAYSKFIKMPNGKYQVICSDCAVEIPKR